MWSNSSSKQAPIYGTEEIVPAALPCLCVYLVVDVSPPCQMAPSPSPLALSPLSLSFDFYFFVLGVECSKMAQIVANKKMAYLSQYSTA